MRIFLCDTIGVGRAVAFMSLFAVTLFLFCLCVVLHNINKE